jgi:hypothetical protein
VMLLSVLIAGAPFSIKLVAVFLVAAGLARLGLPRRATEWWRQNSGRITEAVDPSAAAVAGTPRVPLDELLVPVPGDGAAGTPEAPAHGSGGGGLTSRRSAPGAWELPPRQDRDR